MGVSEGKVKNARLLKDGTEVNITDPHFAGEYPNDMFMSFGPYHLHTYPLPDDTDTVVELELIPVGSYYIPRLSAATKG